MYKYLSIIILLFTMSINLFSQTGTITGNDRTVYKTIKIGEQWWMAENLKETRYRSGDVISNVTDDSNWAALSTGARCAYNNDANNESDIYGYLYNWYAVNDSRNIAPPGWHVPTDEEWKELEMALGISQSEADDFGYRGTNEGSKLAGRAASWYNGNLKNNAAFDESGFSALPAGYRYFSIGSFNYLGYYALFWSSTGGSSGFGAWSRSLYYGSSGVERIYYDKPCGFSVRLVRD